MEAILTEIYYSHSKHPGEPKSKRISVPNGQKVTVKLNNGLEIELDNSSKEPACRWSSPGRKLRDQWQNEQISSPIGDAGVQVLTVYRNAIDAPHKDH
jgi:hypothetical protein